MNKCVICFVEHNNQWSDGPNMYCEKCAPIREQSRGTLSEILPNLYLSDVKAAAEFDGERICVHENYPPYKGCFHHIPILTHRPNSKYDRTGAIASITSLNFAACMIDIQLGTGKKLLIHCWGGVERSPLTLAWWLVKNKKFETLDEAYVFLKEKRPVVSDRQFWLP